MAFKDRIKQARKLTGLSQKDFAAQIGVSPQLVSFWENGKNAPSEQAIYKVIELAHIDANFLYQDEMADTEVFDDEERGLVYKFRRLDKPNRKMTQALIDRFLNLQDQREQESEDLPIVPRIPLYYGWAAASAGDGNEMIDGISRIDVADTPAARKADFVVQVNGQSMEPKFKSGDLVLVKSQDDVAVGEIGVWCVDGSAYIKQRTATGLHSLNPDFPDVELSDYSSVKCFGKVIGKAEI